MNTARDGMWLAVVFVLVLLWVVCVLSHIPVRLQGSSLEMASRKGCWLVWSLTRASG
jgi:hypothetical protein